MGQRAAVTGNGDGGSRYRRKARDASQIRPAMPNIWMSRGESWSHAAVSSAVVSAVAVDGWLGAIDRCSGKLGSVMPGRRLLAR